MQDLCTVPGRLQPFLSVGQTLKNGQIKRLETGGAVGMLKEQWSEELL
jgi:hypothetical protein